MCDHKPNHIVITGAAGAIGSALASRLAKRHPDARFTLVDLDSEAARKVADQIGLRAKSVVWDLAHPEALDGLWDNAVASHGGVDMLVNCAGVMEIRTYHRTPWEMAEQLMNINLMSPLKLMHLALNGMSAGDSVVNISSMAGRVQLKGCGYYGAAKAGLAMASEIAFIENRAKDIHVLTVYPGPVYSNLESRARGQVEEGFVSKWIPTGQPGPLADRILTALERKDARVIYPDVYGLANRFTGLSAFITARFSPEPNDHP